MSYYQWEPPTDDFVPRDQLDRVSQMFSELTAELYGKNDPQAIEYLLEEMSGELGVEMPNSYYTNKGTNSMKLAAELRRVS